MEDKALLSDEQVDTKLSGMPGWQRAGGFIQKTFQFSDFRAINRFLPYLAATIVTQNHHPDFNLDTTKKQVYVRATTHSAGSTVTQADLDLAEALNAWDS